MIERRGVWVWVSALVLAAVLMTLVGCFGGGGGSEDDDVSMPDGVNIEGDITGGDGGQPDQEVDAYNYVRLYITFNNTTDAPAKVVIPACYTFLDPDESAQNGLNVWRREFTIPANKKWRVLLGTYCMNSGRSAPHDGRAYELGGRTTLDDLKRLCEILQDKEMARNSDVQSLVWKVTSGQALTDEDWELLESLASGRALQRSEEAQPTNQAQWLEWIKHKRVD